MVLFGVTVAFFIMLMLARKLSPNKRIRLLARSLVIIDGFILLMAAALAVFGFLGTPTPVFAAVAQQQAKTGLAAGVALAAAISTGAAALGAGIAVAVVGSAAVGAVSENPENLGRTLIFVGLAEGIAIYGLIISFLILNS